MVSCGKKYRVGSDADPDAAREYALYIINDGELYHSRRHPLEVNYAKKILAGTFDFKRGIDGVVSVLVEPGIRKYYEEFGSRGYKPRTNMATKILAAEEIMEYMMDEILYFVEKMKKESKKKRKTKR